MAALIADDGSRAIAREIEIENGGSMAAQLGLGLDLDDFFEVKTVCRWIIENGFKRIALQFPDNLLTHSWQLCKRMRDIIHETDSSPRSIFVLGDTSYGSCCVDDVGAQHNGADCVVHIGPACMSPTDKVPVAFVYGRQSMDLNELAEACSRDMADHLGHPVVVLYDLSVEYIAQEISNRLQEIFSQCILSLVTDKYRLVYSANQQTSCSYSKCSAEQTNCCSAEKQTHCCATEQSEKSSCCAPENAQQKSSSEKFSSELCSGDVTSTTSNSQSINVNAVNDESSLADTFVSNSEPQSMLNRAIQSNVENTVVNDKNSITIMGQTVTVPNETMQPTILCIGSPESTWMSQVQLKFNQIPMYVYNPVADAKQCQPLHSKANKVLARRFYLMDVARNASVVGILVGTMSVKGYDTTINRIRDQVRESGRKSYTFMMGKINPQKLANFAEIDVFVLVACPLNSLVDSKEYYKPIVTPMELEIALGHREWEPQYSANFQDLLIQTAKKDANSHEVLEEGETPAPHFSMAQGGMVQVRKFGQNNITVDQQADVGADTSGTALHTTSDRKHITLHYSSPAAELLAERTYQGLEPAIGKTKAEAATPGQTGIASGLTQYDGVNPSALANETHLR